MKEAESFAAAAEEAGLTVSPSEPIARGAAFPEVGVSPALERVVFALPVNGVSEVIDTGGDTVAIVHLVGRQDVTPDEIAEARETLRNELLVSRQNEFYSSYMTQVQQNLAIDIDYATLDEILGA